ncbi:MAG: sulfatase [Candidatus Hydrogenedentes bacterium]|nr:sulfatase [Candidatus Hydrogenedentota bacterium]
MKRREFIQSVALGAAAVGASLTAGAETPRKPNVVYVFADQWRAQATGYAGDPNVQTPNIDVMAAQCLNLPNAVSGWPVCSPYRGSLITGQYPHVHGVFCNDVCLNRGSVSIAEAFKGAGYHTGYIGKWHLDGHGRSSFIPRERRQGFEYWRVLECTHDYNQSYYYGDSDEKLMWDGYDVFAQTRDAQQYIRDHAAKGPFALFLSWGPPHNPYQTAPEEYHAMYDPATLELRPNVTPEIEESARKDLAGYYAHCTALDQCVGDLRKTLRDEGIADDTIFVFTSDHGDMLGSQGEIRKQRPWDESLRVPFLIEYPRVLGTDARSDELIINSPDIMPTLLGLSGIAVPRTVQGTDYSPVLRGESNYRPEGALMSCLNPFGEWTREKGGREYRGVRTMRYTYVRSLDGPWLLYDNETDPYQMENLCNTPGAASVQARLDGLLNQILDDVGDEFLPGAEYVRRWGYETDEHGTVPYKA